MRITGRGLIGSCSNSHCPPTENSVMRHSSALASPPAQTQACTITTIASHKTPSLVAASDPRPLMSTADQICTPTENGRGLCLCECRPLQPSKYIVNCSQLPCGGPVRMQATHKPPDAFIFSVSRDILIPHLLYRTHENPRATARIKFFPPISLRRFLSSHCLLSWKFSSVLQLVSVLHPSSSRRSLTPSLTHSAFIP